MKGHFLFKYFSSLVLMLFLLTSYASLEATPIDTIRKDGRLDFMRDDSSVIVSINIEIADTPQSRRMGLMNRELPDFSGGMLFIFKDVKPRNFWMRNTPTSLDMVFVDEDYGIVNIAKQTIPMSGQLYSSKGSAKYVVEVKAGFAEQYGIKEGSKIRWERL